jgi:hypothetical protein
VGFAHVLDLSFVVVHEFVQHIDGRNVVLVVILDALQLGEDVDTGFQLLALFVEQEVIVAKMWSADVPMKVLGLDVERKRIGQQRIERGPDLTDGRSAYRAGPGRFAVRAFSLWWSLGYLVLGDESQSAAGSGRLDNRQRGTSVKRLRGPQVP